MNGTRGDHSRLHSVTLNGLWKLQNVDCWQEMDSLLSMQSPCSAQRKHTWAHTHTPKNKHTTSMSIQYPCHNSQGITSQDIKTKDTTKVLTTLETWNGGFMWFLKKGYPLPRNHVQVYFGLTREISWFTQHDMYHLPRHRALLRSAVQLQQETLCPSRAGDCNKSPQMVLLEENNTPWKFILPLKIYHLKRKGSSSKHHFSAMWNFGGVCNDIDSKRKARYHHFSKYQVWIIMEKSWIIMEIHQNRGTRKNIISNDFDSYRLKLVVRPRRDPALLDFQLNFLDAC